MTLRVNDVQLDVGQASPRAAQRQHKVPRRVRHQYHSDRFIVVYRCSSRISF